MSNLLIDPEFQGQGIGYELIKQCFEHFPDTEWIVQTTEKTAGYYEKIGFKRREDVFFKHSFEVV
jgi:predicted N-acetyltransferase YhbS